MLACLFAFLQVRYSASESEWLVLARERLKLNVAAGDLPSAVQQLPPQLLAVAGGAVGPSAATLAAPIAAAASEASAAAVPVAASSTVHQADTLDSTSGSDNGRDHGVMGSTMTKSMARESGKTVEVQVVDRGFEVGGDGGEHAGRFCFQVGQLVWARVKGKKQTASRKAECLHSILTLLMVAFFVCS